MAIVNLLPAMQRLNRATGGSSPEEDLIGAFGADTGQVAQSIAPSFQPQRVGLPSAQSAASAFPLQGFRPPGGEEPGPPHRNPPLPQPPSPAPTAGFNEDALRQAWLSYGKFSPADLKTFLASRPDIATGVEIFGGTGGNLKLPNGKKIDAILAAGLGGRGAQWMDILDEGGGSGQPPSPSPGGGIPPSALPSYTAQFDDPSTLLLEQYLKANLERLKQPAYTGPEAEVLRTRAFEPIEADRQAARQRALARISQAGYLPSSGTAQELLNQIDTAYDMARAGAQNTLAYGQIGEERSRQQEALSLVSLLQQLPSMAQQQALAAIGLAPSPESMVNQLMALFQIGQQGRQQGLGSYEMLGALLPYLTRAFPSQGQVPSMGGYPGPGPQSPNFTWQ